MAGFRIEDRNAAETALVWPPGWACNGRLLKDTDGALTLIRGMSLESLPVPPYTSEYGTGWNPDSTWAGHRTTAERDLVDVPDYSPGHKVSETSTISSAESCSSAMG
jgi:hypothetical protein